MSLSVAVARITEDDPLTLILRAASASPEDVELTALAAARVASELRRLKGSAVRGRDSPPPAPRGERALEVGSGVHITSRQST